MEINFKNTHNPILPLDQHFPDCEAHVMPDGKLYLYGSYDSHEKFYCSGEYHVVSTPDLENWTIHETSLKTEDIPWFSDPYAPKYPGVDWTHPTEFVKREMPELVAMMAPEHQKEREKIEIPPLLYAPDCIHKDGKYYLYFCLSDESEGVAVADTPIGPFTNPIQLPIGEIDPAIFVDDDGSAYLYWGQFYSKGVRLNDDMVSLDPENIVYNLVTEQEHYFHEGSSMRKIGDTYYYVFADIEHGKPTSLGYATGKSPLGPFTYGGVIIDNAFCDPQSWNNHGSIESVNGQWYIFYHRSSRNSQSSRRVCIEPITILPDGRIPEVKMTSQGAGKPFGPGEKIYGYQACELHGSVYIGAEGEETESLQNCADHDRVIFRYLQSNDGFSKMTIKSRGKAEVLVRANGKTVGKGMLAEAGCGQILLDDALKDCKERLELEIEVQNPVDFRMIELMLQ